MARCNRIYRDELGRRCICRARLHHFGACLGHQTSEDLVPSTAIRRTVAFGDSTVEVRLWESELPGVWMAYAPPPYDVMTQGHENGGSDDAVAMILECLELTAEYEEKMDEH
jgi:hypothetical protein